MINPEILFLVEEDPDGGFTARALNLPVFTQGDTIEEVKQNIKDALLCHFGDSAKMPSLVRLHIVKEETLVYA